MAPAQNPMAPQQDAVPLQNATAPAQAAPPAPVPAPAVPPPMMAPLPTAPVANVTVAQPTAAPATPAATQPTVAQAQPDTVPTNAQIQYAQPGECKYHWNNLVPRRIPLYSKHNINLAIRNRSLELAFIDIVCQGLFLHAFLLTSLLNCLIWETT